MLWSLFKVFYGVGPQVWANSEMSRLLDFWGPKIQHNLILSFSDMQA